MFVCFNVISKIVMINSSSGNAIFARLHKRQQHFEVNIGCGEVGIYDVIKVLKHEMQTPRSESDRPLNQQVLTSDCFYTRFLSFASD